MELLLRHDAVAYVRDKDDRTPFHSTASTNSIDAMKMLLRKASSVNERDCFYRTAIHDYAYFNFIAAMELLLQYGNLLMIEIRMVEHLSTVTKSKRWTFCCKKVRLSMQEMTVVGQLFT